MDKVLFDELITSCNEAIEHQKGNIKLKSTIIEIPESDISAKYNKLPEEDKKALNLIIDRMLKASNQ